LTSALATTNHMSTEIGWQRSQDDYLFELSRHLIEQYAKEVEDIKRQVHESMEEIQKKLEREDVVSPSPKIISGVNFASLYSGGKVYDHSPTHSFGSETYKMWNIPLFVYNRDSEIVLHTYSDTIIPGSCWPFHGQSGFITIKLSGNVEIGQVSYEHADIDAEPPELLGSAPRVVEIWAGLEPSLIQHVGTGELSPGQKFVVINAKHRVVAKFVKFVVAENSGAAFTCLYRLGVYAAERKN